VASSNNEMPCQAIKARKNINSRPGNSPVHLL